MIQQKSVPAGSAAHPPGQAASRPRIVISANEHARLLSIAEAAARNNSEVAEYLSEELHRAEVVEQCADHIVQMGSTVTYRDDATGRTRTLTLVYPAEANIEQQRISVLTPVGAALIGMSPAQSITWPGPGGSSGTLTVLDVRS